MHTVYDDMVVEYDKIMGGTVERQTKNARSMFTRAAVHVLWSGQSVMFCFSAHTRTASSCKYIPLASGTHTRKCCEKSACVCSCVYTCVWAIDGAVF